MPIPVDTAPLSRRNARVETATFSTISETLEKVWLSGSQSKSSRADKELEMKHNQSTISKTCSIALARPTPLQQDVAGTPKAGVWPWLSGPGIKHKS